MKERVPTTTSEPRLVQGGLASFAALREAWDELMLRTPSPFLTHAWLSAWWQEYGRGTPVCATRTEDGRVTAAVLLGRRRRRLAAPVDLHSGDWDAVTADDAARTALWRQVGAELGGPRITLEALHEDAAAAAEAGLGAAGYRCFRSVTTESPYLELPESLDALLAGRSQNLRQQWRRRDRALQKQGVVRFRTTTGGEDWERDLETFLRLEASGWKARGGTAILSDPRAARLYRAFCRDAAEQGWLRLYVLELDGELIAGDLGCAIGGVGFLIKTAFDEDRGRLSPGLVLRGHVLAASIEEGLRGYDFLGGPDDYKVRWTDTVRPRLTVDAFRGPAAGAASALQALKPVAKQARARWRALRRRPD